MDHKKSQDKNHAITKSGEIRITRSRRNYSRIKLFSNPRSQDHIIFRISDHKITLFFVFQIIRSFFFRIPEHKIIFFPYLRSQDHFFFVSQITRSFFFRISDHKIIFFFVSQITRSSFLSYLRSHKII